MVAAMMAPCSVKAYGRYLRCCPRPAFKVANCDLKAACSSAVSWNMKSAGKRSRLRRCSSEMDPPCTSPYLRDSLYAYANGDPISYRDPTGKDWTTSYVEWANLIN